MSTSSGDTRSLPAGPWLPSVTGTGCQGWAGVAPRRGQPLLGAVGHTSVHHMFAVPRCPATGNEDCRPRLCRMHRAWNGSPPTAPGHLGRGTRSSAEGGAEVQPGSVEAAEFSPRPGSFPGPRAPPCPHHNVPGHLRSQDGFSHITGASNWFLSQKLHFVPEPFLFL